LQNKYTPIAGDWFTCVSDNYDDVNIYNCFENKDDQNKLYAAYYTKTSPGVPSELRSKPLEHLAGPFFPSISSYVLGGKNTTKISQELDIFKKTQSALDAQLDEIGGKPLLISDAVAKIVQASGLSADNVVSVIKLLMAEHLLYEFHKTKAGEYIRYTIMHSSAINSKKYYGSLAEEIALKSHQISLLISHGPTVGNYREHILRSLLTKYLPSKFSVVTGFIEGLSRQIDILIIDSTNYSPVFKEGDLVVARREAVRAIIEVKSTLDTQTLKESLALFYDITRGGVFKPDVPLFKGIFAFDTKYVETSSLAKAIRDFYVDPYFEEQLQQNITRDIDYLFREITAVAVLNKHFVFSKYIHADGDKNNNMIPSLFSVSDETGSDIQSAMFIASLFQYLDVDFHAKRSSLKGFSDLLKSETAHVKHEINLTNNDWAPSLSSPNEHDNTQPSIKARLAKISEWFGGRISTAEYVRQLEDSASK